MDHPFVLPIIAKMYETSIFCYNAYGNFPFTLADGTRSFRHGKTTSVYFYRPDGKVQFQEFQGHRKPWKDVVSVYYDSIFHYNSVELREDLETLSNPPFIGSNPEPTNHDSSIPRTNDRTDSPPRPKDPPPETSPVKRPPAHLYTPCASKKSPKRYVHENPLPSPLKNEILQTIDPNPYLIPGGSDDPTVEMYRSKGEYEMPMTRENFNRIIEVILVENPGDENEIAVHLKWKSSKKERGKIADILRATTLTNDMFADDLNPLFPNGLEVAAWYQVPKKSKKKKGDKPKKFGKPRSSHGYARRNEKPKPCKTSIT
eukprot:scaffold82682_cov60-Cyclotella_meneghiniana.AAC.2